MSSIRSEWNGSETSMTAFDAARLQEARRRGERLPRAVARRLAQDRVVGHPEPWRYVGAGSRFGEAVARLLAAGHDDLRCDPLSPQLGGVVETGPEHRVGRPSYCAAPSTMIACDCDRSSLSAACQTWKNVTR